MRLIDADELKINLYHNKKVVLNDDLVNCIDDTETAYDVDNVVEKLGEIKVIGTYPYDVVKEAIEIVKGGGVSGDN